MRVFILFIVATSVIATSDCQDLVNLVTIRRLARRVHLVQQTTAELFREDWTRLGAIPVPDRELGSAVIEEIYANSTRMNSDMLRQAVGNAIGRFGVAFTASRLLELTNRDARHVGVARLSEDGSIALNEEIAVAKVECERILKSQLSGIRSSLIGSEMRLMQLRQKFESVRRAVEEIFGPVFGTDDSKGWFIYTLRLCLGSDDARTIKSRIQRRIGEIRRPPALTAAWLWNDMEILEQSTVGDEEARMRRLKADEALIINRLLAISRL